MHGRQNQQKRLDVLHTFSCKPSAACLICTDVAARGIDFPSVDIVIQLNCPPDISTYIHRIGRTARYEKSGTSILFLLESETLFLRRLEEHKVSFFFFITMTLKRKEKNNLFL
jgi:ATP-dependent RNA helicase DDX10/DBP4